MAARPDDENFWKPGIRGLNVVYESRIPGQPDFAVSLGEDDIPELITVSEAVYGILYTDVALGVFCAGDCPMDLSGVILPEEILFFSEPESAVDTGRTILARCRENGRWNDYSLLSVTRYWQEHIRVFEYGRETEEDRDGGSCFVAVNSQSGSVAAAWDEE